jgi:hypothetical protein
MIQSYKENMFEVPGSTMVRQDTRKYFPNAIPRSTLSGSTKKPQWKNAKILKDQVP